ncbi:hypothetical protein BP5796_09826 [Coleophoma crateriformis]|uniref:Integral membrane protein n=1 Tax=Coleophoma crateriformis TaxID=565419 RepID=A0A3D8QZ78_9HELO|nr:hypothetical protein BP5796_09826 [Coleophoma crateriformis]
MSEKDPEFVIEEWSLYGLGAVMIMIRFAVRLRVVGWRHFRGDDCMAILVLTFFTMGVANSYIICGDEPVKPRHLLLTDSEISTYEYGSKEELAAWVTPDPGPKCTLKLQNFLVTTILNILKLVIFLLLPSGLFIITAAIIRVVLTLSAHPSALNINRWGNREVFVGIITINIPILRPLFTTDFWRLHPCDSAGSHASAGNARAEFHGSPYVLSSGSSSTHHASPKSSPHAGRTKFAHSDDDSLNRMVLAGGHNDTYPFREFQPAAAPSSEGVRVHTTYEGVSEPMADVERTAGGCTRWDYSSGWVAPASPTCCVCGAVCGGCSEQ